MPRPIGAAALEPRREAVDREDQLGPFLADPRFDEIVIGRMEARQAFLTIDVKIASYVIAVAVMWNQIGMIGLAMQVLATALPGLRTTLGTTRLDLADALVAAGASLGAFLVDEGLKVLARGARAAPPETGGGP